MQYSIQVDTYLVRVAGIKPSDRINGLGHWTVPDFLIEMYTVVPTLEWSKSISHPILMLPNEGTRNRTIWPH